MSQALIKTPEQLALMRESGRLLGKVFDFLDGFVAAGQSTLELDTAVERLIRQDLAARPASKGQYDYPYCINTSINEVVCHGMPDAQAILKEGDIVNIDITLEKNGFIADSSKMYLIGPVAPKAQRLVEITFEAMWAGIKVVRPGARLGDIGHAIQSLAQSNGYSVVREYCGHGIGRQMHEEPQILHFGRPGTGLELREGMVFTIEPMLNQGSARTRGLKDGWTVVTRDNSLSAQWEHTVAVTRDGFEVLTLQTP
ncbi:type I methionyl aminopeptidase [Pseudomonas chlororaphis]|jgi:methionyl aminopeptidase|uniref:Methionine aminopeptidase n=1 Tax=Pseudomonas morbosilactucae TaxID=2938197 RepID=A0ABT0JD18_9PSED|nr:type I methionyl aminopeptidase [Pseudomonas morbosilactucae]MCK9813742.1 type I methionyl aminopeptidase [Pseudomonas morbosilactucae]ROL69698.1 type I methionyl aminopeptidase [Pseudomonas chlororaphis]WEK07260.1 MAG: type I methionyl aminopeptidase [Pseudomonas sp.]